MMRRICFVFVGWLYIALGFTLIMLFVEYTNDTVKMIALGVAAVGLTVAFWNAKRPRPTGHKARPTPSASQAKQEGR